MNLTALALRIGASETCLRGDWSVSLLSREDRCAWDIVSGVTGRSRLFGDRCLNEMYYSEVTGRARHRDPLSGVRSGFTKPGRGCVVQLATHSCSAGPFMVVGWLGGCNSLPA